MTEQETRRIAEAVAYLMSYDGKFPFLVDMKKKVHDPTTRLSEKQVIAVLNCKKRDKRGDKNQFDPQTLEIGVYKISRGENDQDILKVVLNKAKTRKYAKRLVPINGTRLNEYDERVKWDWTYAPGDIDRIRPEYRMTEEEAKLFGTKYGICASCGRPLKDAKSVEAGIGPVCIKHFRW